MRQLNQNELAFVSGAGGSCCRPCKQKGNNGYGNGGNDGVPGNSDKQDETR